MPHANLPLGVTAVMLPELDFDEQLALCQQLGVTHYSVRPRDIPPDQVDKPWGNWGNHRFDLTPRRLLREAKVIGAKLRDAGITPFGTVPAATITDSDDDLKLHFEGAAAIGAGRVRVAPHRYPDTPFDYGAFLGEVVEKYQHVVGLAKSYKLKVVIETHSYSMAASPALALNICRGFDPADLGTIFDIANFTMEGNYQPQLAVSVLGPYIDHVHIGGGRRITTGYDEAGFQLLGRTMCPVTETDLNIPDWLRALAALGRELPLVIEDYTPALPGADRLAATVVALQRALKMIEG